MVDDGASLVFMEKGLNKMLGRLILFPSSLTSNVIFSFVKYFISLSIHRIWFQSGLGRNYSNSRISLPYKEIKAVVGRFSWIETKLIIPFTTYSYRGAVSKRSDTCDPLRQPLFMLATYRLSFTS